MLPSSRFRPLSSSLRQTSRATRSSSSISTRPPLPPANARTPGRPSTTIVLDRLAKGTGETVQGKLSREKEALKEGETPSRPQPEELLTVLQETIKTNGPLPVSRYMTLCLNHPTLGYYTTRKVFGKEGDFVTSPEISQVFGELLAIWYVTQWLAQGSPKKVRFIELGPGKGTLLADILRTFRALPPHSRPPVASIHLIEASSQLQAIQKSALEAVGAGSVPTQWHGDVKAVPGAEEGEFTMLVAHEFFDALPIHVFEHTQKGWREVLVDITSPNTIVTPTTPSLRLVLAPSPTPASALYSSLAQAAFPNAPQTPDILSASPAARPSAISAAALNVDTTLGFNPSPPAPSRPSPSSPSASAAPPSPSLLNSTASLTAQRFARLPLGSRIEVSPASWEIARDVARLVSGRGEEGEGKEGSGKGAGGAGLVVDYGDAKAFGRSWRGFRKHQVVDPLTEPGHTDLTANVDFSYLAEAMSDYATTHGPLPQSRFLTSLGLQPRLAGLLRNAKMEERRKEIESAARRLVDQGGMGGQYKVMGITPKRVGEEKGKKEGEEGVFPFDLQ
ncbi:hypothetical protein JCM8547_002064 [Rhodosporidiobolus lusitaniae]